MTICEVESEKCCGGRSVCVESSAAWPVHLSRVEVIARRASVATMLRLHYNVPAALMHLPRSACELSRAPGGCPRASDAAALRAAPSSSVAGGWGGAPSSPFSSGSWQRQILKLDPLQLWLGPEKATQTRPQPLSYNQYCTTNPLRGDLCIRSSGGLPPATFPSRAGM